MPIAIGPNVSSTDLQILAYNFTYSLSVPNVNSFGALLPVLTNLLCGIH